MTDTVPGLQRSRGTMSRKGTQPLATPSTARPARRGRRPLARGLAGNEVLTLARLRTDRLGARGRQKLPSSKPPRG